MTTRPIPVFKWQGDLEIEDEDEEEQRDGHGHHADDPYLLVLWNEVAQHINRDHFAVADGRAHYQEHTPDDHCARKDLGPHGGIPKDKTCDDLVKVIYPSIGFLDVL